ncbi:hypothetical protein AYO20_05718 [Fonsecaea nubica]|uniref:ABC transporter domain-containing protein n=1 Tax=Fonsecaea nubica TaxID=856822 RepID=A0A178D0U0_9EURO|nr:hypothetical protein AYO20_05718 [Fonsecaea nubica]OAL35003.1 hypothetical protein AYO20_05718 [Fonsecaea nubica]
MAPAASVPQYIDIALLGLPATRWSTVPTMDDRPTPDVPGRFPTQSTISSMREHILADRDKHDSDQRTTPGATVMGHRNNDTTSSEETAVAPNSPGQASYQAAASRHSDPRSMSSASSATDTSDDSAAGRTDSRFEPLRAAPTAEDKRPRLERSIQSEDDLFNVLSRRRTSASGKSEAQLQEENDEIERLMSRMFGQARQEHSEEEKTRHSGVIFRGLTVKGVGLGASLQPTVGDIFLGLPRMLKTLFTKGAKAALGKPPVRELLSNLDGCVRPGEMLLVLGRPGSGCSTFLKAFCNQREGFEAVQGEVTYGGIDAKTMKRDFRGEVIYNPEDDLHYPTLTVKHTLMFALKTRTPGKESRLEGESRADYKREFLRVVTKLFWIEHTLGTKVGDQFVRGVSGGEKKRVSIAEAMITRASVQGWDNSSRGLDASTALEYVQCIRTLTNMARTSTAVSLYQAGESLYQLVDKVLLLHEGQCLYFGSADDAKQYFINLGFECKPRWTTSDFLTSVTDPHARAVRKGWEDRIPRDANEFAALYRKSEVYQRNLQDIGEFEAQSKEQRESREQKVSKHEKKNYAIPFHKQVLACTQRQFLVMLGDRASLIGKWGGIGLIVGSLFFQMPETTAGAFPRGGAIFFVLLFNALLALAEMTAAFTSKPILLKHKSFSFYRPAAYAFAQTVVDIPLIAIQVLLFNIIIYWMAGLAASASQFFISCFIIWTVTMVTYAYFRMISALCKTLDDATRFTGVSIQILVVYTGYLIPPDQMRVWFSWLRRINWIQYGFECLMANEFTGLIMECVPPYLVPQGPNARPQYQSCTLAGSEPGQTTVNGARYIQQAFGYSRSHLWRNFGFLWAFFAFFLAVAAYGMERMKPNAGGGAITVFKRGQVPKRVEQTIETGGRDKNSRGDEESVVSPPANLVEKVLTPGSESTESTSITQDNTLLEHVAKNETVYTFRDINYTIPYEKSQRTLLQNVQGYVRPGKLTALMGASGAGKTTLLNALAQRINFGTVTGEFLVDGRPLPRSFQRATGFAEQMDIHEPTSTVREALQFSALLRQPKEVPVKEKYAYCETIIDLLEMRDIAGATIGTVGEGLNQEQRKRLTIGVELASKPELLMFLDEPTSGLDSGAAFNIVRFLRKLADAGQAILCTIHQPSAVLFEHFDELLLLKSGGRVVYHGPLGHDSQELIHYFEDNGARKCPPDANPAEYMLEVIGAGDPNYKGKDWGDVWEQSTNYRARSDEISEMIERRKNVEHSKNVRDDREYAMPLGTQTTAVVKRSFVAYWRTPNYILGKFILHIMTGLFTTFTFYHLGFASIDMQSRLFAVFLVLTISPPLIQQLQPVFIHSRDTFQSRENKAKIYSWFAWTTGAVLAEIPYSLVAGAVFYCCWWFGIAGYRSSTSSFTSGFLLLCILLFELYYISFGQAIASFAPNELLASLLVPVFFLFVVSFCGVVVPPQQLPEFWRSWMYWLTPFHYLLEAMLGAIIHNQPVRCNRGEFARFSAPPGYTCQSYTQQYIAQAGGYVQVGADGLCEFCQYETGDQFGHGFSVYYSHRWRDFGIFIGFIMFNYAVVYTMTFLRVKAKNPFKMLLRKGKQMNA